MKQVLSGLLESEKPDLVLANVENLAHGKRELSEDTFRKYPDLLVRPANIPDTYVGKTAVSIPTKKGNVLIGNFMGNVFMEKQFHDPLTSPFAEVEKWLKENKPQDHAAVLIDFHAEATSEKVAFGYYLDGRVSAVLGTHTHIPTADAKVLPGGTAYITDVGMCGAAGSVLGVKKELSLERFTSGAWVPFDIPEDPSTAEVSYVIIEVDETTRKALNIKSFHQVIGL